MPHYFGLTPEALLVLAAIVALFADRLGGDRSAAIIGSIATFAAVALVWVVPAPEIMLGGRISLAATPPTLVLRAVIAGLTGLLLIWVAARGWGGKRAREAVAMVLFASAGGMLLVSATDIVVLFVAMELSTMPSYVLAGYSRDDRRGLEGALKYFLLSVLTSLITAYGLSFVYGLSGATDYAHANISSGGVLATVAAMLVLVGLLAKLTVAPFHFWSPDAMAGAPVTSAAYISSIAKIAPMWALVRLLVDVLPTGPGLSTAILIVAVISMTLGILAALTQTDLRRMIAYSGISNAGFMMLGVAAGTAAGYAGAVLLVVFYSVSVLGLLLVVAQEGATLQDVAGLIKRRPYAAWASVAFLFSIIGFPPFIGFYGKLLAEDIEDMDPAQAEAIRATGAGWLQWINYGVQPQVMPRMIGLGLYRFDINFRESAVVGIVGGGGIGATLNTAFDRYEFDSAAAILLVIIAIVMVVEYSSGYLRRWVQ
jgi:proton-translocating NADH-quinone oxidoreductase chain N